jgi:hypothetical protein
MERLWRVVNTELDIARGIQSGQLTSPQYCNNHWLFDLRITGTGSAYRAAIDKDIYRPPEHYLNNEFIARCNGLSVIWEHPDSNKLDSESYGERVVGAIMLPYIKGQEVWGVARIYDESAAREMITGDLSTSPAIIFKTSENKEHNGVLVEGSGTVIDHLAICESGVWDKDDKTGININNEAMIMDENQETAPQEESSSIDERILALLEGINSRLGKLEAAEEPATETKDDESAEETESDIKEEESVEEKAPETEEAFADSAIVKQLKAEIDALKQAAPKHRSNEDYDALAVAQVKAESVYSAFGDSAAVARPMDGETVLGYRKRMLKGLQKHSKGNYAAIDITAVNDPAMLSIVEEAVYADAMTAANSPTATGQPNGLPRAFKSFDEVGRPVIHYKGGDPMSVFEPFRMRPRHVKGLHDVLKTH